MRRRGFFGVLAGAVLGLLTRRQFQESREVLYEGEPPAEGCGCKPVMRSDALDAAKQQDMQAWQKRLEEYARCLRRWMPNDGIRLELQKHRPLCAKCNREFQEKWVRELKQEAAQRREKQRRHAKLRDRLTSNSR